MLQKKILTINRDTGQLLSEKITGAAKMSEEKYFEPFMDYYKEALEQLRLKKEGGQA